MSIKVAGADYTGVAAASLKQMNLQKGGAGRAYSSLPHFGACSIGNKIYLASTIYANGGTWSSFTDKVALMQIDTSTFVFDKCHIVGDNQGDSRLCAYGKSIQTNPNDNTILMLCYSPYITALKLLEYDTSFTKLREVKVDITGAFSSAKGASMAVASNGDVCIVNREGTSYTILDRSANYATALATNQIDGAFRTMDVVSDGTNFFICGETDGNPSSAMIYKVNGSGTYQSNVTWRYFSGSGDTNRATAMTRDSSGNLYVTGYYYDLSTDETITYLTKFNSSLSLQYSVGHNTLGWDPGAQSHPGCLTVHPTSRLTHHQNGGSSTVHALQALTSNGNIQISNRRPELLNNVATEAATMIVVGSSVYWFTRDTRWIQGGKFPEGTYEAWEQDNFNVWDASVASLTLSTTTRTPSTGTMADTSVTSTGYTPSADTDFTVSTAQNMTLETYYT